jgi:hypothetical protein
MTDHGKGNLASVAHKRFLVIVRAGDRSLHPQWLNDPAAMNWDLIVSYFGDDPHHFRTAHETRIDDKGTKWQGLHALLTRSDVWRRYDYIWLPDDDLSADTATINALFRNVVDLRLSLAQPALSWESYFSHPVTIRHPSFHVRWTNFVEIMAPCFERSFLEASLPTFGETLSGWGLDWLLPHRLGVETRRSAVIDAVTVTHTRAVGTGSSYTRLAEAGIAAQDEGQALLFRHGFERLAPPTVVAAMPVRSDVPGISTLDDGPPLHALLANDWAAFLAARQRISTAPIVLQAQIRRYGAL